MFDIIGILHSEDSVQNDTVTLLTLDKLNNIESTLASDNLTLAVAYSRIGVGSCDHRLDKRGNRCKGFCNAAALRQSTSPNLPKKMCRVRSFGRIEEFIIIST